MQIGHNNPPSPTPFEAIAAHIDDLFSAAKDFLDGEPVTTQPMADQVGKLLALIRAAEKDADALRKAEVKPLDVAKAEIQGRYAPLIGNTKSVTGKTVLAADACKKALAPFLAKQDRIKREAERAAYERAEAARRAAQQAVIDVHSNDLAAAEVAERAIEAAKDAEAAAKRAAADTAKVAGGSRAVSLRTTHEPELRDLNAAVRHYWPLRRERFEELVLRLAIEDVRAGKRDIPGFEIIAKRVAV